MTTIGHHAISASAGSGKTFQLAHRFIRLLANGVPAERVIALTFSRKAAGEIFDAIVRNLCLAASEREQAKAMSARIEVKLERTDYLQLLKSVLRKLHRLHIGTLDSFTIGIVKAFPLELGLSTNFDVLDQDGPQAATIREEVLAKLFDDRSVDKKAQEEFLESFKLATFGQEEKGLHQVLERFIEDYHRHFLMVPDEGAWGDERRLWPKGSAWLEPSGDVESAHEAAKAFILDSDWNKNLLKSLDKVVSFAGSFDDTSPWDKAVADTVVFKSLIANRAALKNGEGTLQYNRREFKIVPDLGHALYTLIHHLIGTEIRGSLARTSGIYRILREYEKHYDVLVRRRGKLTFEDAQYLLSGSNPLGGAMLSQQDNSDTRLYIDYRLDSQLDHWLLDEFQDTSDLQWETLRNLIDELLQDNSGEKSFFYVGDVKQAIYGWRGGNAKLFNQILDEYGDRIQKSPLSKSFRSSPPIIEAVNEVFHELSDDKLPQGAVDAWKGVWERHSAETKLVAPTGYVTMLEPSIEDEKDRPTSHDRYKIVANILNEINPTEKGLSAAVLVRGNEEGRELVNLLRSACPTMSIAHEGRAEIKDNPVVAVLLSLIKCAAHPGDTMAWRHVNMSPLSERLNEIGVTRDRLPLTLLSEIYKSGYQHFISRWGEELHNASPLDAFGRKRLTDLIDAAGEFDQIGSRDADAFLLFIDKYKSQELAAEHVIRVMTIHQSKGLGFDVVILPDLQGRGITGAGAVDFVRKLVPDREKESWALKFPRRVVSECDELLASELKIKDQEAAFDALCVLYVAMTRAKQGLYMVTSYQGKDSKSFTHAALLKSNLCGDEHSPLGDDAMYAGEKSTCLYACGEKDWHHVIETTDPDASLETKPLPPDYHKRQSRRQRVLSVSPSRSAEEASGADVLFTDAAHEGRELGSAVHECFEQLEWYDPSIINQLCDEWKQSSRHDEALKQSAILHVKSAMESGEVREALEKPAGDVEVWREKSFEIILDKEWITGTFDRVVITNDKSGIPVSAVIMDYKSNDVTEESLTGMAAHYQPQLQFYQKVLAKMLDIGIDEIQMQLIFTKIGRVATL